MLCTTVKERGGHVSSKTNSDGTQSPYELNINYHSLLSVPDEHWKTSADRFLASQAIMLAMPGVPGIYFHSLIGSVNCTEGVSRTGAYRSINREKLELSRLEEELTAEPRSYILNQYKGILRSRIEEQAFDPYGDFRILNISSDVFAVERYTESYDFKVLCLHNMTSKTLSLEFADDSIAHKSCLDLLSGTKYTADKTLKINLAPYMCAWLKFPE
jgi:sucrose phosphorylase